MRGIALDTRRWRSPEFSRELIQTCRCDKRQQTPHMVNAAASERRSKRLRGHQPRDAAADVRAEAPSPISTNTSAACCRSVALTAVLAEATAISSGVLPCISRTAPRKNVQRGRGDTDGGARRSRDFSADRRQDPVEELSGRPPHPRHREGQVRALVEPADALKSQAPSRSMAVSSRPCIFQPRLRPMKPSPAPSEARRLADHRWRPAPRSLQCFRLPAAPREQQHQQFAGFRRVRLDSGTSRTDWMARWISPSADRAVREFILGVESSG